MLNNILLPITFGSALLITGCSHENPLLNDEAITSIRNLAITYNVDDPNFDIECKDYLIGQQTPSQALKQRCDTYVHYIYNRFNDRDAFQKATAADQFDPKLWRRVFRITD